MAKDPAFNFYTNDFDQKTKFFTHEQVGMYLRLLMAQHQHGHLTEAQMMHICGRYDADVFGKFTKDAAGKFFNDRMDLEIEKRRSYSESRKQNRNSKKGKPSLTHDNTYVNHMSGHMENENEIENEKEIRESIKKESLNVPRGGAYDESLGDVERWTKDVLEGNDPLFLNMVRNRNIILNGQLEPLARDHLGKCARYNWHEKMTTQQAFRHSLLNYVAENLKTAKEAKNGKSKVTLEELNKFRNV